MSSLMRVDLHTRKVCFNLAVSHCCDDPLTETDRFDVVIISEGREDETGIAYDIFEISPEGYMCIVLDDAMKRLCPGRYLFRVMFDACVIVDDVKFQWGGKPVITDVICESDAGSAKDGCFGDFETSTEPAPKLPDACCCPEEPVEECDIPCYPLAEHTPTPIEKL